MTFKQYAKQWLTSRGMFEQQADAVIESWTAEKENEAMAGRWDDQVLEYPDSIWIILALSLRQAALTWIDANMPLAWYRPMFAEDI